VHATCGDIHLKYGNVWGPFGDPRVAGKRCDELRGKGFGWISVVQQRYMGM